MTHEHPVYDNDGYFVLDPMTKSLNNQSGKTSVIQYDHNSEEIRFKFPKIIEGHDMSKVDLIQIHFDNTSTGTSASLRNTNAAPLNITDTLKECEDDPESMTCSWLIGEEATQLAGTLKFKLKFICFGDDNVPDYKMSTLQYTAYQVLESPDSTEGIIEIYPDIITEIDQLKRDVEVLKQSGVSDEKIGEAIDKYLDENPIEGIGEDGKSAYQIALDNGFEGTEDEWLESLKGETGAVGPQGPQGEKGDSSVYVGTEEPSDDNVSIWINPEGVPSESSDGFSPTIEVTQIENGHTITVTDVNGEKTFNVLNGEKGDPGATGPQGEKGDTGATGPQGPQGEKGDKPVKGVDYFTEADKAAMVDEIASSLDGIPSYWQPALDEGVEAINTALANAGYNKSAFLFYSDAHFDYGSRTAPKLLKYLYNHTGMTKTFFGGDIVNSEAADYEAMSYLWEWRNMLKDLPNHHSVVGNHDDGNATNNLFSEQYIYSYLLAAEETTGVVRGKNGLYYYIDNSPEKTRYIFLDTAYKGMTSDQTAFLKETLIGTKEDWHIVVVAHIWYEPDYDRYNERPVPITGLSQDASIVTAMLDNYNSRLGEYADCKAWVEFCVGGHIHYDYDGTTSTGIPIILVETDSLHLRGNYGYTPDTTTESSVNGIVADYDNHKISVIRIGRGQSREIEVTNYPISYTNVLPTALASDGTNVYNGTGYKADTRWSSSGNTEGTAAGVFLTGYIPCQKGDTVYLKNITMPNANGNSCLVHFFNENFATAVQNSSNDYIENTCNGVWGADGNLKQFTIPSSAPTCTHIRIQCGGINDASVITINEPIE